VRCRKPRPPGAQEHTIRTNSPPLYDNSLAGILARLTHGILHDANERVQEKSAPPLSGASSAPASSTAGSAKSIGWLDRLDTWFWKQEMKNREAFLARSTDIFDLEQRMRCLERGDRWLGTDRIDSANRR
jgi:Protein of unknown function (DUF3563)